MKGQERGREGEKEGSNYLKENYLDIFSFRCSRSWTAKREAPFDWVKCKGSLVQVGILT